MNEESLEKMSRMRLLGMHQAFKASTETDNPIQQFTNDELVHHLVQSEWDDRQYRSVQRGLKNANFRYKASVEQLDYKVLYSNTAKLMSHLKMAKADGAHLKELSKIEKQDALILDDFGVQPFDAQGRALLLDIIEDRHGKRSTIITAQVPVKKWHEIIGEKTLADAILDRIVHQSIRIELYGESLRKKKKGSFSVGQPGEVTMESFL
jgi:DNA replication protein DnaC